MARLEIIGCGNPLAGDDSAGVEIVRRLGPELPPGCRTRETLAAGVELLDVLDEAKVVLFVDAVVSGAQPGTLHLVPLPWPGIEPRALGALSSHGWGLAQTLQLSRSLGRRIPRMALLGIEIESAAPGAGRTQAVEDAVCLVVERFPQLHAMLLDEKAALWHHPLHFLPGDASFRGE